jgi:hypothetical protein
MEVMLAAVSTFPTRDFITEVARDFLERDEHLVHEESEGLLEARNPGTGETWVITCLGEVETKDEFDSALGRLLKTMRPGQTKYGIAGPSLPAMHHHVSRIHPGIRDQLRLHYLIVDENGTVRTDTQYFD